MINRTELAERVSELEGKKISVSLPQIREIQKIILELLSQEKASEVLALLEKVDDEYWDEVRVKL